MWVSRPERRTATFAEQCSLAFSPLVTRYGFEQPKVHSAGYETYVEFHKGDATVSVSQELGAAPLVELLYPPGPDEEIEPFLALNGVDRTRRVLRIGIDEKPATDDASLLDVLVRMFTTLEAEEQAFLAGRF